MFPPRVVAVTGRRLFFEPRRATMEVFRPSRTTNPIQIGPILPKFYQKQLISRSICFPIVALSWLYFPFCGAHTILVVYFRELFLTLYIPDISGLPNKKAMVIGQTSEGQGEPAAVFGLRDDQVSC